MLQLDRRSFLVGASAACFAGPAIHIARASQEPKRKIAMIGCGGRAKSLRSEFDKVAQIAWVCDPDKKRLADFEKATGAQGTTDMRRVLDDREVQAVVIATPDHWHAPAAILACTRYDGYATRVG
jgi:hypothetical protein